MQVVGLVWGFIIQQFSETVYVLGAGFILAAIVSIILRDININLPKWLVITNLLHFFFVNSLLSHLGPCTEESL